MQDREFSEDNREMRPRGLPLVILGCVLSIAVAVGVGNTLVDVYSDPQRAAMGLLARGGSEAQEGKRRARAILARSPYSPRLLSAMAVAAESEGESAAAQALMETAASLTSREPSISYWLFRSGIARGNFSEAVRHIDSLLRVRPELSSEIFPLLIRESSNPGVPREIAKQLATRPPWRLSFLQYIGYQASPEVAYTILSSVQNTAAPLAESEATVYVSRMAALGRVDEAYLAFRQFLPPQQLQTYAGIFNGEFENLEGISPFTWELAKVQGAALSIEPPPERPNDPALHVIYNGLMPSLLVRQMVALVPGAYRLSWTVTTDTARTDRILNWGISCVGGAELMQLKQSRPRNSTLAFMHVVVPKGCPAQYLQLKSNPDGRMESVDVWYDKFAVESLRNG